MNVKTGISIGLVIFIVGAVIWLNTQKKMSRKTSKLSV